MRLKSSQDPATLKEILKVVDRHIRFVRADSPAGLSMHRVLALSCLNMAEEMVCLKQDLRQQTDQLELSTQSLFADLKSSSMGLSG